MTNIRNEKAAIIKDPMDIKRIINNTMPTNLMT